MSNLLFIRHSLQLRHAAVVAMREARAMPVGPIRNAGRRRARALEELARTEAWLEGQSSLTGRESREQSRRGSRQRESIARGA